MLSNHKIVPELIEWQSVTDLAQLVKEKVQAIMAIADQKVGTLDRNEGKYGGNAKKRLVLFSIQMNHLPDWPSQRRMRTSISNMSERERSYRASSSDCPGPSKMTVSISKSRLFLFKWDKSMNFRTTR